ncbi:MAG: hypothetical protein J4F48_15205, partial [Nitrospinae bacterium]|nr:hypothetical protein [Nitrospinota bacterium]
DVLLVDTAGRLHTKHNLMEELKKLRRLTQRLVDTSPHEVLLVLDATSGQNVLTHVREFGPALGVTGLVLNKLDATAKGAVALRATYESGIPIRYVGVGESVEDLLDFDPDFRRVAQRAPARGRNSPHFRAFAVISRCAVHGSIPLRRISAASFPPNLIYGNLSNNPVNLSEFIVFFGN